MVVEGLLYTKDHEWAKVEGDVVTMGITDYAQEQLGELVFVELPQVGKQLVARKEIAVVESSKAAGDVYSPVTGTVTEVNSELGTKPELINEDCYKSGWICKLQVTDKKSLDNLMNAKKYQEYLDTL
ncbi:MAG: glycine cleavage system protein GcvH [Sedimentisphaerales bacterium]|jgi:glycine cleavage system H protein|nr:glycine cleavage system protein GcvH [Sedimentisphaerales bacterium]HNY77473.1 glycine cleavage system protein GcvH [Sedimentisphaerales bacterium]HOC62877.1 glycine cleavage system protein GcvH [Sedimentisphaerales bacterium]HOH63637.1 glycine cleavage system protein GcvH [Sedimentisphaerales bacterium]HPY49234.1 glycine cleavage system protein GcvH [Sedimentisphaerales bacterium]